MLILKTLSFSLAFFGLIFLVIAFVIAIVKAKKINAGLFAVGIGLSLAFLVVGGALTLLGNEKLSTLLAGESVESETVSTKDTLSEEEKNLFYSNLETQLESFTYTMDAMAETYNKYALSEGLTPVSQKDVTNTSSNLEGLESRLQTITNMESLGDAGLEKEHDMVVQKAEEVYIAFQNGEAPLINGDHNQLKTLIDEYMKSLIKDYNAIITSLNFDNDKLYSHAFEETENDSGERAETEEDLSEEKTTDSGEVKTTADEGEKQEKDSEKTPAVKSVGNKFEIQGITLGLSEGEVHNKLGTPDQEGPQEGEMISYDWMNHYGSLSVGYNADQVTGLFYETDLVRFDEAFYQELEESSTATVYDDTRIFYHEDTDQALKFEKHDGRMLVYLLIGTETGYQKENAKAETSQPVYNSYYNERYGFSFEYPANLEMDPPPTNGDGVHFYNGELDITAFAAHTNVIEEETIDTYYHRALNEAPGTGLYSNKDDNWYVLSYEDNGMIIYEQFYYGDMSFNTFIIQYPVGKEDKYNPVVNHISETFQPGELE